MIQWNSPLLQISEDKILKPPSSVSSVQVALKSRFYIPKWHLTLLSLFLLCSFPSPFIHSFPSWIPHPSQNTHTDTWKFGIMLSLVGSPSWAARIITISLSEKLREIFPSSIGSLWELNIKTYAYAQLKAHGKFSTNTGCCYQWKQTNRGWKTVALKFSTCKINYYFTI